jgi:hypothetical protein
VQSEILRPHPDARLRVYAIWTNKLFGDARNRWDAAGLTDPRVVHLWDGEDVSGDWLVQHVRGYDGGDWDTYLLFGPDATWPSSGAGQPAPLESSGGPVDDQVEQLDQALGPVLATSATR